MRLFLLLIAALLLHLPLSAQMTLSEAVARLRQTDFADENTWIYPELNRDSNRIEVTKSVGDCWKKVAFIDPKTKFITISDTLKSWPYCRQISDMVASSELVIEGECLEQGPAYRKTAGSWPEAYTPHLIKIFKVFKGVPLADTIVVIRYGGRLPDGTDVEISDGQIGLPGIGIRAILFLASFPETQYHDAGPHLNAYPKWAATDQPIGILAPDYSTCWYATHIEDDLYKVLEKATRQPRRIVGRPTWNITELHSNKSSKKYPQEPALIYKYNYAEIEKNKPDVLRVHLFLQSGLDNTYPIKGEVLLRYNPAAFGKRIIANGLAKTTTQVSNYGIGGGELYRAFFPRYYQVSVTDSDDSTLLIRFQCKDLKQQLVMLSNNEAQPFLDVFFSIKNYAVNTGFKLLIPPAASKHQRRFDYEKNRIVPYRFVLADELPNVPLTYFFKPEIHRFYPDTVVAGSNQIVTVEGKWLLAENTQVGIPCSQGYCFIKAAEMLECTDTRLRFTIPLNAVGSVGRLEKIPNLAKPFLVFKRSGFEQESCYSDRPLIIKSPQ